jgi:hypothetical protein
VTVVDDKAPERDSDRLVAWLREGAHELENAHRVLDECPVPRVAVDGKALSLAGRIAWLLGDRP